MKKNSSFYYEDVSLQCLVKVPNIDALAHIFVVISGMLGMGGVSVA